MAGGNGSTGDKERIKLYEKEDNESKNKMGAKGKQWDDGKYMHQSTLRGIAGEQ